jgi:hypothetical protein
VTVRTSCLANTRLPLVAPPDYFETAHAVSMSSSAPLVASSGAGEGDTTLALATMVPYSSDGPTLPLIGGASERSDPSAVSGSASRTAASSGEHNARTSHSGESRAPKHNQKLNNRVSKDTPAPSKPVPKSTVDLGPLHTPWTLLPPDLLRTIEARIGGVQWWEANCVSVVFTRNQNVRSGINRLKAYLGYEQSVDTAEEVLGKLGKEDVMIAVSAQGEATTKLVGIVEMVRRVVRSGEGNGEASGGGGGRGGTETWYMYTSLASRVVGRGFKSRSSATKSSNEIEGPKGEEATNEDFEMRDASDDATSSEGKSKKLPVLTAWMSKKSIPELKKTFGEQTFDVQKPQEAG